MSRIGKKPIAIPSGVEVKIEGNTVTVKGSKGTESVSFRDEVKVSQKENQNSLEDELEYNKNEIIEVFNEVNQMPKKIKKVSFKEDKNLVTIIEVESYKKYNSPIEMGGKKICAEHLYNSDPRENREIYEQVIQLAEIWEEDVKDVLPDLFDSRER